MSNHQPDMNDIHFAALNEIRSGRNEPGDVLDAIIRMIDTVSDTHNDREMSDLGFNTLVLVTAHFDRLQNE